MTSPDIVLAAREISFSGRVIGPADSDYDKFRTVFYGGVDTHPAVIIRVANTEDVRKAIWLARDHGLELAVRSGGHSIAGYSTSKGGVVIDLRDLKKLEIDMEGKTVWAETGLKASEMTHALDQHNLVLGFGDTGSVGIGGITLGGGVGFLARKYGLTIDNLLAAEVVTAEGEILEVDAEHHSDLFWAIRGGGGNFGVVTKFKYRLHELGEVLGGMLFLPATAQTIEGFIDIVTQAPEELSTIANIMPTPPMPFIPAEHHGQLSIMGLIMYAGSPEEGEKVIAPLRALATPWADMLKPMRYKDIFFPTDESFHPTAVSKNLFMKKVDHSLATTILEQLNACEAPMRAVQLRVLGGAVSRVDNDATAYAHREEAIMTNVAAFYTTPEEQKIRQTWVEDTARALNKEATTGYVGFLGPRDSVGVAYPEATLQKLTEIKKRYDPENLFHRNLNIVPR